MYSPLKVLAEAGLLVVGDELDDAAEEARLRQVVVRHLVYWLAAHAHVLHCVVCSVGTK